MKTNVYACLLIFTVLTSVLGFVSNLPKDKVKSKITKQIILPEVQQDTLELTDWGMKSSWFKK